MTNPSFTNNPDTGHHINSNPLPNPNSSIEFANPNSMAQSPALHLRNSPTTTYLSFAYSISFGIAGDNHSYKPPIQLHHVLHGEQSSPIYQTLAEDTLNDLNLWANEGLQPLPVILEGPGHMEELITLLSITLSMAGCLTYCCLTSKTKLD